MCWPPPWLNFKDTVFPLIGESQLETLLWILRKYSVLPESGSLQGLPWSCFLSPPYSRALLVGSVAGFSRGTTRIIY